MFRFGLALLGHFLVSLVTGVLYSVNVLYKDHHHLGMGGVSSGKGAQDNETAGRQAALNLHIFTIKVISDHFR